MRLTNILLGGMAITLKGSRRTPIESIQRAAGTRAKREAKEFHSINRTLREKFKLNLQFSINYWPASHDTVLIRLWALLNHHQLEIAEK